jgi:hypothetical protein
MKSLFGSLYLILFFSYVIAALFITFHIIRYSLSRTAMIFGLTLFLLVFVTLLLSNVALFFSLPLDSLFPKHF